MFLIITHLLLSCFVNTNKKKNKKYFNINLVNDTKKKQNLSKKVKVTKINSVECSQERHKFLLIFYVICVDAKTSVTMF